MAKKKVNPQIPCRTLKERMRRIFKFELFANLLFFSFGLLMLYGYQDSGDMLMLIIGLFLLVITPMTLFMFKKALDG